jgi:hypothetical protein
MSTKALSNKELLNETLKSLRINLPDRVRFCIIDFVWIKLRFEYDDEYVDCEFNAERTRVAYEAKNLFARGPLIYCEPKLFPGTHYFKFHFEDVTSFLQMFEKVLQVVFYSSFLRYFAY